MRSDAGQRFGGRRDLVDDGAQATQVVGDGTPDGGVVLDQQHSPAVERATGGPPRRGPRQARGPARSRTRTSSPRPRALDTPMPPPISSDSCLEIASPRPVPPNFLDVDVSACWNGWNRCVRRPSDIPMPVSRTSTRSSRRGSGLDAEVHDDLALGRELDRVADQVDDDLPEPRGSPTISRGTSGSTRHARSSARPDGAAISSASSTTARGRTGCVRVPRGRPRSSRSRGCR